uniref:Sex-determination protein fem-3 n=1 Tax=Caenorhabditis remanei TaxID=31234 RepID=FEM3_CAERE|nr:RecName: Full=Sex-determination protein fem-3; AltName: Full=Cr-FEM-3 [Caenorhabditis remanei]AAN28011.1 sex determination protein FEM-3 [Caenorhabditis remanei]
MTCDDFRAEDEQPIEVDERRRRLKRKANDDDDDDETVRERVDDAESSMEVFEAEYPPILDPLQDQREAKYFRERMQRFDLYSRTTGLSVDDIDWPLIRGRSLQKGRVAGISFVYDDTRYPINRFSDTWLLCVTKQKLFSFGAGCVEDLNITSFVLRRTMKVLSTYCNWLFEAAKRNNRRHITHKEIQELINRDGFRFHQYLQKFLIGRGMEYTEYNNRFFKYLHEEYNKNPGGLETIYSNQDFIAKETAQANYIYDTVRAKYGGFEELPLFRHALKISFTQPGEHYFSRFYAKRFHEALGCPPLDSEIIMILDWFGVLIMNQIAYKTIRWHEEEYNDGSFPVLDSYHKALADESKCPKACLISISLFPDDPLFDLDIDYGTNPPPVNTAYQKVRRTPRDPTPFYRLMEFEDYKSCLVKMHFNFSELTGEWLRKICARGR